METHNLSIAEYRRLRKIGPKRSKYGSQRTEVDGVCFASKAEATRYKDLKVMQQLGLISGLTFQVKYDLKINEIKICSYVSDFNYLEDGKLIVEDTKGFRTPVYKLKRKLMLAIYGIDIRET